MQFKFQKVLSVLTFKISVAPLSILLGMRILLDPSVSFNDTSLELSLLVVEICLPFTWWFCAWHKVVLTEYLEEDNNPLIRNVTEILEKWFE